MEVVPSLGERRGWRTRMFHAKVYVVTVDPPSPWTGHSVTGFAVRAFLCRFAFAHASRSIGGHGLRCIGASEIARRSSRTSPSCCSSRIAMWLPKFSAGGSSPARQPASSPARRPASSTTRRPAADATRQPTGRTDPRTNGSPAPDRSSARGLLGGRISGAWRVDLHQRGILLLHRRGGLLLRRRGGLRRTRRGSLPGGRIRGRTDLRRLTDLRRAAYRVDGSPVP
ncbi:hypothetical protein ACJX0J_025394, partial [Zea mays]